jgi:hypothetical protein
MNQKKVNPELLQKLLESKEWSEAADVFEQLRKKWLGQLIRFSTSQSLESIGIERVKWTAMIAGVETFASELNRIVDEWKEEEIKRKDSHARRAETR